MENVARVGIGLGKQVFHLTAVDAGGEVVERRRLRRSGLRSYPSELPRGSVVAMESCGGAHHWARFAERAGHRPVLLSPQFVKPYVKSNKNARTAWAVLRHERDYDAGHDAADAGRAS